MAIPAAITFAAMFASWYLCRRVFSCRPRLRNHVTIITATVQTTQTTDGFWGGCLTRSWPGSTLAVAGSILAVVPVQPCR